MDPKDLDFDIDWKTLLAALAFAVLLPCFGGPVVSWLLWAQLHKMRQGTIRARGVPLRWALLAAVATWTAAVYLIGGYLIMFRGGSIRD